MLSQFRKLARKSLHRLGYIPVWQDMHDRVEMLPPSDRALYLSVSERTMVVPEGVVQAQRAVVHVCRQRIAGAIVECGVWRGGVAMAMLQTLNQQGDMSRAVYLYDTYEGMPPPGENDLTFRGGRAAERYNGYAPNEHGSSWCRASIEDVREGVLSVGYAPERIHLVKGKVEDTIPGTIPDQIAVLRLDTDWYSSTRHEMEHLWPRLSPGGILIVDDYSRWQGSRKAVDEYLAVHAPDLFMVIGEGGIGYAIKKEN